MWYPGGYPDTTWLVFGFWTCFGPAVWWKGSPGKYAHYRKWFHWMFQACGLAKSDLRWFWGALCKIQKSFKTCTCSTPGTLNKHFWRVFFCDSYGRYPEAGILKLRGACPEPRWTSKCLCWEFASMTEVKLDMQRREGSAQLICSWTYW